MHYLRIPPDKGQTESVVLKRTAHAAHTEAAVSCLRAEDWVHSGHSMHGVRVQRCVCKLLLPPNRV